MMADNIDRWSIEFGMNHEVEASNLPVQSPVDIVNVHQRVQFLGFTRIQNERLDPESFSKSVEAFIFIHTFLFHMKSIWSAPS